MIVKKKRIIGLVVIAVAILAFILVEIVPEKTGKRSIVPNESPAEPQFVREGELVFLNNEQDTLKLIDIEIADDENSRAQGLMHRSDMPYDRGMLFIFDYEQPQSFWMKNTKMSLDIIYVNADLEIVKIHEYTQPYSQAAIPSQKPAQYVIETKGGFCHKFGIIEGQNIQYRKL